MLRRVLVAFAILLVVVLAAAAIGLGWAHLAIRRERHPLPEAEALAAAIRGPDLPTRLSVLNTASQPMPRSAVLDPKRDPTPDAAYVMSHPSFVLEWADGRILLIDAGMTRAGAVDFGKPLQWLAGAQAIAPHGSAAEQLATALGRVQGAVFTHLHTDHVGGMTEICAERAGTIRVFMSTPQAEHTNYTTRPGRRLLSEVRCAEIDTIAGSGPLRSPGFPGVAVIRAGGHTPGSQIVVANVGTREDNRRYVFTGDIVNALDGIREQIPKPFLYRLLMVPEDEERQGELRGFLRGLVEAGYVPLVSHDELALAASGVPAWPRHPPEPAGTSGEQP